LVPPRIEATHGRGLFILTYDEFGGIYDHVSPQKTVNPDGIKPKDLLPGDICNKGVTGPTCNFVYIGYWVPLIVVSPYRKKHYVSHTVDGHHGDSEID
jgi:phospholipase C